MTQPHTHTHTRPTSVAFHTEPLQLCCDMFRQGIGLALSTGHKYPAFLNMIQHICFLLHSGQNLPTLLDKVDYYLGLAATYKNDFAKKYLSIFRKTISILIDKGESTSSSRYSIDDANLDTSSSAEVSNFHRAIQGNECLKKYGMYNNTDKLLTPCCPFNFWITKHIGKGTVKGAIIMQGRCIN